MPSNHRPPTIDPVAATRWAEKPTTQSPWLHEEVARRMSERLPWIRLPVEHWVHWEPLRGGVNARELVAAHYPKATCFEVVARPDARTPVQRSLWQRLHLAHAARRPEVGPTPPEGGAQLVWANMLLHQTPDPVALIAAWQRALSVNGFLMFSCLGPDTLKELRTLYATHHWPSPVQDFTDMHDWGDLVITTGFADPVVSMEHIRLTFDSAPRLLEELRGLGCNTHPARFAGLRTPAWRKALEAAIERELRPSPGAPLALTFEVIYGHAVKPKPRPTRVGPSPRIEFNSD
jgi:malonyl-CoA O-methyltransferase